MVFSERACSGAKRNNEVLTTPHIPAGKFSSFHFPVKKAHYSVRKNLHCTHCGQRKTLILYSPKEGIIPLFQNKNSVILIPIFLFKARAFIIGTRTQNIVHFVFRTRKTSFSPTRFFGIKRKQQQQQYSFKIIIYMYTFVADEHLSTRFCTVSCNLYIIKFKKVFGDLKRRYPLVYHNTNYLNLFLVNFLSPCFV